MTSPTNPVGDAVRFVDDERLDIPDARALQTLIYEYMADALGGLMGETSGALTDITFTTGDNAAIGIGECTLCGFKRRTGSSARVRGGIFHYDPTSNYQAGSTTVDLSAYVAGTDNAFLWFRRVELPADLATRHKYDSTAEREKTFSMNTKYRTKLAFGASNDRDTPPNELYDWFVFAQVISWNATVPTIAGIHPIDVGVSPASLSNALRFAGYYLAASSQSTGAPASYSVGLAQALTFLGQRVSHILDSDNLFTVAGAVTAVGTEEIGDSANRGLKQLDADLTTAEGAITSSSGDVQAIRDDLDRVTNSTCIASYIFNWTGATYEVQESSAYGGLVQSALTVTPMGGCPYVEFSIDSSTLTGSTHAKQLGWHGSTDDVNADVNGSTPPAIVMTTVQSANVGRTIVTYRVSVRLGDGTQTPYDFCWSLIGSLV